MPVGEELVHGLYDESLRVFFLVVEAYLLLQDLGGVVLVGCEELLWFTSQWESADESFVLVVKLD